jgi:hypothetical protein
VTISNPDSLPSSETGVNPEIRRWTFIWLSSMLESNHGRTSIYVLNWSKMAVLIAKST